jgi:hypothetical protein
MFKMTAPTLTEPRSGMADLWVVLTLLAFFGLCVALVKGCDVIIGPDDESELSFAPADEVTELAAEVGVQ